jgi:signal transduction histidine kinase/CheY-like chemotaxis protein
MENTPGVGARIAELTCARARRLAPALFFTFVFYVLADAALGYETPGFPYVWAWVAAAGIGAIAIAFVTDLISERWCHVATAALLWCSTSSTIVTLAYTPKAGPVLLIGVQLTTAGIMLSTRWVVVTLVAILAGAVPVLLGADVPGLTTTMALATLGTAAAFALLIHLLVHGATVTAVKLQLAEAETAHALARKLEEADSLHEQLLHAQRMEAVGTLAAGLAHDMNNVLGAITNLAELVAQGATAAQREDLAQIVAHAGRGGELTRGLLAFSRRGQYRKRVVAFDALFDDTFKLLRRMLPKSIEIRDERSFGDACIEGDPVQLTQVIANLALNAADAMGGSGVIAIRARTVTGTRGRQLRIDVTDTGHGMDVATQARVFEPFFTTKPMGKGSGLGLAVVWGIVEAHDGRIELQSAVGHGTTFTIHLPTTTAHPTAEHSAITPPTPLERQLVLVADDEDAIRESTRRLLARMGLDVVVASNGEEALAVFDANADKIRLVVLDMGMPVMGGAECFARLRERSKVPVLVATGYADDEQVREVVSRGAMLLEKPFTAPALREQVGRVLELAPAAHISQRVSQRVA